MAKTTPLKFGQFRIFLDLDGVIANWIGGVTSMLGINDQDPDVRKIIRSQWNGIEKLMDEKFIWKNIDDRGQSWWANLELYPWTKVLVERLKGIAPVYFLTQNSQDPSSAAGKVEWIHNHFDMTDDYLIGAPKHACASPNAILIDDNEKKTNEFDEAGGFVYRWPHAYDLLENNDWSKAIDDVAYLVEKLSKMSVVDRFEFMLSVMKSKDRVS